MNIKESDFDNQKKIVSIYTSIFYSANGADNAEIGIVDLLN